MPRRAAVSGTERDAIAARPPSRGWANSTSGRPNVTPRAARSKRRKNDDASASGCDAEQTSCQKPGSVSSSVRQPPPIVGAPSITCTRNPAAAIVTAAARPFGPLPTITASSSGRIVAPLPVGLVLHASPERGDRGRDGLQHAAHHGVVPDVAGVAPLPLGVHAGAAGLDLRVGQAQPAAERGQRRGPEL